MDLPPIDEHLVSEALRLHRQGFIGAWYTEEHEGQEVTEADVARQVAKSALDQRRVSLDDDDPRLPELTEMIFKLTNKEEERHGRYQD